MKKTILTISILALLVTNASSEGLRLVRLTVSNNSGLDIAVSLTGRYLENFYYLRVEEGDATVPARKVFTLIPDIYSMRIYYLELWDPVYGESCKDGGGSLDLTKSTNWLVVPQCEPNIPTGYRMPLEILKYGLSQLARGR